MATTYNDNNQVNAPKDIDNKTGKFSGGAWIPYASVSEANSTILSAYRYKGLRVRITEGSNWAWYHYRDGITDGDLVREDDFYRFVTYGNTTQAASITETGNVIIKLDGTTGSVTYTINPTSFSGRTFKFVAITSGNTCRVSASSGTIVGQSGANYDMLNGEFVEFVSDGTNLYVKAKN